MTYPVNGTEVVLVQGVDPRGYPSGEQFATTTQDIANLAAQGGSAALRTITAPGDVTVQSTDGTIEIDKTIPETTVVYLPSTLLRGFNYTVVDRAGVCSNPAYRIVLTADIGDINGQPIFQMNSNYQAVTFYFNGTNFRIKA